MAELLTRGIIPTIVEGGQPENPCVQILHMKKIPSGTQERWRLLVSDGQWSSTFAMLATQLNDKVMNNEISTNCIIQMNRYVCNTVQDSKKVLIILDLDVLKSGEAVGQKIGTPVNYDPKKTQNNGQSSNEAPAARVNQPPRMNQAPSGGMPQRNPLAERHAPNASKSPPKTPSGGSAHPIASLTPYQNRWTICARVTNKSSIRTWSNSRGEGKLFSMDLLDTSGEIRATAFNEQLDKFYDMIEINKVYFITGGTLKTANKQYSNLNNDYELTLNRGTEIVPCHDTVEAIPTMQYSFVPFDQLDKVEKTSVVDVIGVCKEAQDLSSVTQRTTGRELKKRDLQLVDDTNHEVRLTIWGTQAEQFDGSLQPVLAIKGAKVSDFNGVSLSALSSSTLQINPDIREAHKLKGWFDNGGSTTDSVNLSNQRGGTGGAMGNVFKTFKEAKNENIGARQPEAAEYFSTKATIALIKKENCLYNACTQPNCNKKVVDMGNGLFRCEKCNVELDNFSYRLMLQANVVDSTDNQWITIFQDQAESVLGTTAQELGSMQQNNSDAFQNIFADACFKTFNFRMRVKMDTYNDESRLRYTAAACTPLNAKEYNRRLLSEIKQMANQA